MLKLVLKFAFAGGIIYWMISSGKLDFNLVPKALGQGLVTYGAIAIIITQGVISAYRWKTILEIKSSKKIPFFSSIALTWIGLFFNTILPGAVSGDLLKMIYAKDLDKDLDRGFLFTSVFVDRIFGLIGLISLTGFFTLLNYSEMIGLSKGMSNIIGFNLILLLGTLCFFVGLFLPKRLQVIAEKLFLPIPLIGEKIVKVLNQLWLIGKNKNATIKCLIISVCMQFLNILAFWLLTKNFYGKPLDLTQAFTFIPIGLISVAVPISPSGAGVGHLIFNELFGYVGIKGGASLFNLYFLSALCINLLGIFPYLFFGKHHDLKEVEEMEQNA